MESQDTVSLVKILRFVLFSSFILDNVFAKDNLVNSMVVSYVKNEDNPTAIVLYKLCWDPVQILKMYKALAAEGFFISTSMQEERPVFRKHELLAVADLDCPLSLDHLLEGVKRKLMRSPIRWLVLRNAETLHRQQDPKYQRLSSSKILSDSDFVIVERIREDHFEFIEVHKPSINSSPVETPRGWWKSGHLRDIRTSRIQYRRRRDLHKIPLTMSNVIVDSNDTKIHLPLEDRLDPQHDTLSKVVWSITRMGFEMLNATPTYSFSDSWGYPSGGGNWTGMIKDLLTDEAVIGTSCLFTHNRFEVVDFVAMVAPTSVRFVFRQPPLSYISNVYTMPFSSGVWLSIVACILASFAALLLTSKWEASLEKGPFKPSGSPEDVFMLTVSAICQQGCALEPRKASGRIMMMFLFTSLMALYSAYSANIVVLLQAPSNAINNLQDLYNSKLTIAANDLEYNKYFFKKEKEPLRRAIYEKKIAPPGSKPHYYHIDEGVKRIREGLFAFHSMTGPIYRRIEDTFLETEKCGLVEIDYINEFDPWLPVQKESPYNELFRVVFKHIQESGLQDVVTKRLQVPKPRCSGSISAFSSVSIVAFYPAVLFMLYGFMLSLGILLIEIGIHRLLLRKKSRNI